ncbi:MAG: porin family protein [Aquisalimonadaceae bacterium]
MNIRIVSTLIACLALPFAPAALAGPYVGLGIGTVDLDTPGFEDPRSLEIIGGYDFSRNFAFEVSYIDIGDASDNIPPEWILSGDTLTFGILGKLPITPEFEIHGKFGFHKWDLTLRERGFGTIASDDGTDLFFGFGATYHFPAGFGVGGRYMLYDVDGSDISVLSANLLYAF